MLLTSSDVLAAMFLVLVIFNDCFDEHVQMAGTRTQLLAHSATIIVPVGA